MKTIALPIENKVRETDGKLWLGLHFVREGHDIVLGPAGEIKKTLDKIKPDVYITKDPGDGNIPFIKSLKESNILVCGLDTEGRMNINGVPENKNEILNYLDIYFLWGDGMENDMKKSSNDHTNIKITGNPRFDLLIGEIQHHYSNFSIDLKNTFGDYVLVNTNFPEANSINRKKLFSSYNEIHPSVNIKNEEYKYSRIMYSFIELILHLSQATNCNIVVRPHPGENHTMYESVFEHFDNIFVEHEDDVRYWIYDSKGVIHYDCTTGIEAALMKKPVLSYQPLDDIDDGDMLSQVVSKTGHHRSEVLKWMNNFVVPEREHTLTNDQNESLLEFFPNINSLAAPQICDIVKKELENHSGYKEYPISSKEKIEMVIKSSQFSDPVLDYFDLLRDKLNDENYYVRRRKKQRQKFPGMSKKELMGKSDSLNKYLGIEDVKISQVPRTNYCYKISLSALSS